MQETVAPAPGSIFPVVGQSMSPLMDPGDQAVIEFCPAENLVPGDIAVLLRWGEKNSISYVTHRVILNLPFRGRRLLLTKSDVGFLPDRPLFSSQAVGRVAGILKRGTLYAPDTSLWFLKSLYSLCAYRLLWLAFFLAAKLFALFCLVTPAFLLCLKNSLYLRWEVDFYPSLAAFLALPVSGGMKAMAPLKIPPAVIKSGIINSDETWEGTITIQNYLQVAPGAAVTVLPGAEIIFEREMKWVLPLLRGGSSGVMNEMNSPHARIQVYGGFRALGSAEKPVIFRGGGIYALGSGELFLEHFRVSGGRMSVIGAADRAHLECRNGYFSGCKRGALLSGTASGFMTGCVFDGGKGPSLRCVDSSSLVISASKVLAAAGNAVEILNEARAGLSGLSVRGGARGVSVSGSARLTAKDCYFRENTCGMYVSGRAFADFDSCRFKDNKGPSADISGRARGDFSGCVFDGGKGPSLRCRDSSSLVISASEVLAAAGKAVEISNKARVGLSGLSVRGCAHGVLVSNSARLTAKDCRFEDNKGPSVEISGRARAEFSGFTSSGAPTGIVARDNSSLRLASGSVRSAGQPALSVSGPVRLSVSGVSFFSVGNTVKILTRGTIDSDGTYSLSYTGFPKIFTSRIINSDETWEGTITVKNYLQVTRGATVTVLPGTEIIFKRGGDWILPGGSSGVMNEMNTPHARIQVYGGFRALGSAEKPVIFRGGGIYALGSGELFLEHFRVSGARMSAIGAADRAHLECRNGYFSGCERGALLSGTASGFMTGCVFDGGKGPSLRCLDSSSLVISASEVLAAAGNAVAILNKARAGLSGLSVRGCARGVLVSGSARLTAKDCRFKDNKGSSMEILNKARVGLSGLSVRGCVRGVFVSGSARLTAKDCRFKDNKGPSADISGRARGDFSGFTSAGAPAGIVVSDKARLRLASGSVRSVRQPSLSASDSARLSISGVSFFSVGNAVFTSGRCMLDMAYSSAASEKGSAINLRLSAAELRRVSASGAGGIFIKEARLVKMEDLQVNARNYAILSAADKLEIRGLKASGGTKGGLVFVRGRNYVENTEADAASYPGLSAQAPARLRVKNVSFNGRPWHPPQKNAAPGRSGRSILFRFAAATYTMPVFSQLYCRIYLIGPAVARLLLPGDGVKSLYLYRGMTGNGWVPALSDMDLACLIRALLPREDWRFYSALKRRQRVLKALLPYTGEIMAARDDEFLEFMSGWGIKGREFYSSSKLLYGTEPKRPPPAGDGLTADLTEAFYAYTLLAGHFFSASQPVPFVRRNCLKNYMDVTRYLDTKAPLRDSRSGYALAADIRLDDFAAYPKKEAAFRAFSALHAAAMERLPDIARPVPGRHVEAFAAGRQPGHTAFEKICLALSRTCGEGVGFVWDSLYRFYIIIPDSLAGDRSIFDRAASAAVRAGRSSEFLAQTSVLISAGAFELLSFTAYLNNPLFWLDLASCSLEGGGGGDPNDGGVYRYGFAPPNRRPSEDFTREMAALALKHFAATWRGLWENMPPHYFYSRVAGLRLLLEKGNSPAFSGIRTLSSVFQKTYGPGVPGWQEFYSRGFRRENYEFVAAQVEAARGKKCLIPK